MFQLGPERSEVRDSTCMSYLQSSALSNSADLPTWIFISKELSSLPMCSILPTLYSLEAASAVVGKHLAACRNAKSGPRCSVRRRRMRGNPAAKDGVANSSECGKVEARELLCIVLMAESEKMDGIASMHCDLAQFISAYKIWGRKSALASSPLLTP